MTAPPKALNHKRCSPTISAHNKHCAAAPNIKPDHIYPQNAQYHPRQMSIIFIVWVCLAAMILSVLTRMRI